MNSIEAELNKNGIKVITPLSAQATNRITTFVSKILQIRFPTLKLNYNTLFIALSKVKMYVAHMPEGMSDACYFYKNQSIYFRSGLSFSEMQQLAVHECIHYLQELKDSSGKLKKMGLCTYLGNQAFGVAINEAAVQFMAAYALHEPRDLVKYYDISFPTDSPSYYPLLTNLIKQISYLIGYATLFDSTFYANDKFYDSFKELFGKKVALKLQNNFESLIKYEEKLIELNNIMRNKDLNYKKFKKMSEQITSYKQLIKETFLVSQNMIFTAYFDKKFATLETQQDVAVYRNLLTNYSNLIGVSHDYSYFNDYYIQKINELNAKFEKTEETSLAVVEKRSKLSIFFKSIGKLFGAKQKDSQVVNSYSQN